MPGSPRPARHTVSTLVALVAAALLTAVLAAPAASASVDGADIGFPSVPFATLSQSTYGGLAPVSVTFDGSGSICLEGCVIAGYAWSFGDGATATGVTASHTYPVTGLYTITLTVSATNGATSTATGSVNVVVPTTAVMTTTATSGSIPLTVGFDGTASTTTWDRTLTHSWAFGDGTGATGSTATHTYTTPGIHQASLTVSDTTGATHTVGAYIYAQDPLFAAANLRATSPGRGRVDLTWTNRTTMVERMGIERCAGARCTAFVQVFQLPGTATAHHDSGLRSGTTYRYRVRSYDYLGRVATSAIVGIKAR